MNALSNNPYLPMVAEVVDRMEEAQDVVTLRLRLTEPLERDAYRFEPGQFNMLYLGRVGEVPISISSDPAEPELIDHTIRAVGRVTKGMIRLRPGDKMGLRGPFGTGWPMEKAKGRNLLVITGGIGCAPTASVVGYAHERRDQYGMVTVLHGVRQPRDLIFGGRFNAWCDARDTQCLFTSQEKGPDWKWHLGLVTELLDQVQPEAIEGTAMMCGPEPMMRAVAEELLRRGRPIDDIYVSMERSMQCGQGHCGHCQYGPDFICKDGPVFPYARVRKLMKVRGY